MAESQSLWVNAFEDYVDDFVYFVTTIAKEYVHLPMFLVAHSMGGFISAVAMSRLPTLINRAVLCAPMLRNKCGMKAVDFQYPLPQPVAYWFTSLACYMGMGTMHALGYFKETPEQTLPLNVVTSDQQQLCKWQDLRRKYPSSLITTCVTNDWLIHSVRAQRKFAARYEFVKTNTLILRYESRSVVVLGFFNICPFILLRSAEKDYLVYNRAMAQFVKKAPASKMFCAPGAYHELLCENETVREAVLKVVGDFFSQRADDVADVQPCFPLVAHDATSPIYSWPEILIRAGGIVLASVGIVVGCAMVVGGDKRRP